MNSYLVGGAVRDALLGLPVKDRDWVVVGSTPEQLIADGYRQVGADFPVFLHPHTQEEYALARTERKQGRGYTGFSVDFSPDVTLEEDLARRDLTINAMAQADDGTLIDPFGGHTDLQQRLLRHVSPAFAEDPLRVLRVARFAARFADLGFTLADDTLVLMQQIVQADEMEHLTRERVWQETARALMENRPDVYVATLRACGALARLMPEVDALFGVPQPARHHPEVDTGVHLLLALQQAARMNTDLTTRFAVLTHDLGKGATPASEWPRHHGHEQAGLALVETLCQRLQPPKEAQALAFLTCEFHTHVHRAADLKPSTLMRLFERCDAFRRPQRLTQLVQACEADARGRSGLEDQPYPQVGWVLGAFEAAQAVNAQALLAKGITGKALGEALQRARIQAITTFKRNEIP